MSSRECTLCLARSVLANRYCSHSMLSRLNCFQDEQENMTESYVLPSVLPKSTRDSSLRLVGEVTVPRNSTNGV